jgi:mannosyltransferase
MGGGKMLSDFSVPHFSVRRPSLALLATLALAAILRSSHLGDLSFWFDESFCWKMIQFPVGEIWERSARDNHPPGYFYVLWAWSRAFGDSPTAMRSLSVVCGLGTVLGAYLLARGSSQRNLQFEICNSQFAILQPSVPPSLVHSVSPPVGRRSQARLSHPTHADLPGLLAAALVALSPFQIDWSQQVRMYALGACLTLVSSWLLLRALAPARPRWQDFAWFTLAATALAYTHYFGLFIVAGQFLYAMGASLVRRKGPLPGAPVDGSNAESHCKLQIANCKLQNDAGGNSPDSANPNPSHKTEDLRPKTFWVNPKLVAALAAFWAVGTLWSPWLPVFLRHRRQVIGLFWSEKFTWDQVAKACPEMFGVTWRDPQPDRTVVWGAALACLVLAVGMVVLGRYAARLGGVIILTTFGAAVAASLWGRNIIVGRYFLFAHALLLCGVAMAVSRIRFSGLRRAVVAALLVGAAWSGSRHEQRREQFATQPGMAAAMAYLAESWRPGEPVVVASPLVQVTAVSHTLGRMPVYVLHEGGDLPFFLGTAVMRDDEFISPRALASSPAEKAWVVDAVNWVGGTWTVRLPDPWVDVAEEAFPEWFAPKCQIVVRRCAKRPWAARSGERQAMRSTRRGPAGSG